MVERAIKLYDQKYFQQIKMNEFYSSGFCICKHTSTFDIRRKKKKIHKRNYVISALKHLIQFGTFSFKCTNLNSGVYFLFFFCVHVVKRKCNHLA